MAEVDSTKVVAKLMNKNAQENKQHLEAVKEIEKNGWGELYEKVESLLNPTDTTAIIRFWQVGKLLVDVFIQGGQNQKTVNKMIAVFGKTKGVHDRSLKAAFKFATEFTEDEANYYGNMFNSEQKYRLTQTHIQRVMVSYISKEQRKEYLSRCVKSAIAPDTLAELIKTENGQEESHGGPKFSEPNTPDALLAQINEIFGKIIKRDQLLWSRPKDPALLMLSQDLSFVTETTRTELAKAVDNIEEVIKISERLSSFLRDLDEPYLQALLGRSNQPTSTLKPGDTNLSSIQASYDVEETLA